MILVSLILSLFTVQQDIPYKPDSEFSIRMDLKFKVRVIPTANKVDLSETRGEYEKRTSSEQLPYLILYVSVTENNQGEQRLRILRDGRVSMNNRKIELGKELKLEIGFTDDAKDKISGFEHILYFLSADKKEINRIVITIADNGDYFVNGQKRGRV